MKLNNTQRLTAADPQLERQLKEVSRLVNLITDGRIAGSNNAYTQPPTTGAWAQGDQVRNAEPNFVLTGYNEGYVVTGWICVEGGTPGTWVEMRQPAAVPPAPPPPPTPPGPPPPPPPPAPAPAQNLILWSEEFDNTAWKVGMTPTVATNVSNDPNGTATVDEITLNLSTGQWVRQQVTGLTIGQTYTFSALVQQGRSGSATNVILATNNTEAWNTGASTKQALTGTLTQVSVTWTQTGTTTAALMIGAVAADGNGDATCVGTVRAWGAALNVGSTRYYAKTDGGTATAPTPSSQKIQAENATLTGGVATATSVAGYEGTGHLDWFTVDGQSVTATFTGVTAGTYNLNIRFATYGAEQDSLIVNGGSASTVTYSDTSGTWATKTVPVTLTGGSNTIKLQKDWGYTYYDSLEIVYAAAAAPPPAPPPAPSGTLPAKVLGCYFETYTGGGPPITDVPSDFNLVYIFHAKPDIPTATAAALGWQLNNQGNGAFRFYETGVVTASHVATMRGRGQRVSLTVGGSRAGYAFDTRAKSQNFIASFQDMYAEFGGLDGCDFNNYEAGITPSITEMVWMAGRLKELYGNNFIISTPAGANYAFDQDMCRTMMDAGVLDFANPQFYDWDGFREPGFVSNRINRDWVTGVARGDASRMLVGFSANYANGLSLAECMREYDAIKAVNPTIRGTFCWTAQTNIAGGNVWGSTMGARL